MRFNRKHAGYPVWFEHFLLQSVRIPGLVLTVTRSIPVRSVGCIFAEILGRKAFLQGKNYQDQLNVIFQVGFR